jgi:chemotaxis protein CheC
MGPVLSESQRRLLVAIFERGAEHASQALSQWLGLHIRLRISDVELRDVSEVSGLLGPEETLVATCVMGLSGTLTGELLLVFEDQPGLALADLLLGRPLGTSQTWDELEQSAALETTNIVGCALLNSLSAHLPMGSQAAPESAGPLVPSPPRFRHEFAGSLLEFALMDQAVASDQVLLVRAQFATEQDELRWWLLFVPSGESLAALARVGTS